MCFFFFCISGYFVRIKIRIGAAWRILFQTFIFKKIDIVLYIFIVTQIFHLANCEHYSMSPNVHYRHFSLVALW